MVERLAAGVVVLFILFTVSSDGLNLSQRTQLLITANEDGVTPPQTHLISMVGGPYQWINFKNILLDLTRTGFRWEEVAFNYDEKYVVFSEALSRTVYILFTVTSPNSTELIHYPILKTGPQNSGGERISSVDVDWVSDNIYISDTKGVIYLLNVRLDEGSSHRPEVRIGVVYRGTSSPLAIKVHPNRQELYAIMADSEGTSIQVLDLMGLVRRTIVSSGLASTLSVDYDRDMLYWLENTNNSTCTVRSADLTGGRRRTLSRTIPQCQSQGIDFSSDYVIIANTITNSIILEPAGVIHGTGRQTLSGLTSSPFALVMYSRNRQKPQSDKCFGEGNRCDFCVGSDEVSERCACEFGYRMAPDRQSCQLDLISIPEKNYAVVVDGARNISNKLYIVDFNHGMTISLPFTLKAPPTDLHVSNSVLFWSLGSVIQKFDLNSVTMEVKTIWTSKDSVSGIVALEELIYANNGQTTELISPMRNESRHLINHGLYAPTEIAISKLYSSLYIGLQLNNRLTTPSQRKNLTDRVVQYSLDGKDKTVLVSSQYQLKAMALDDASDRIYTVQNTGDGGDLIYYHDILTHEERLLSVVPAQNRIVGQLAVARDYLYYYSIKLEQQLLWKKNKWDGSERIVESGRIFKQLQGALYVQGDAEIVWSPCTPNPCDFMCIPMGQMYSCECPDDLVADEDDCIKQAENETDEMRPSTGIPESAETQQTASAGETATVNSEIIIGATIGACLTTIIIICLIFIFWAWRTDRKWKIERTISLNSRGTSSTRVGQLATCGHGVSRPSSAFSIRNMPLPELPREAIYSDLGPRYYEIVRDTYLHPAASLKSSVTSTSSSTPGLSTTSHEEPIPYHKALTLSNSSICSSTSEVKTVPVCPQDPQTVWRQSSIYDSTEPIQEEEEDYLRPTPSGESPSTSQYLEILPTTPKPPHKKVSQVPQADAMHKPTTDKSEHQKTACSEKGETVTTPKQIATLTLPLRTETAARQEVTTSQETLLEMLEVLPSTTPKKPPEIELTITPTSNSKPSASPISEE